MPPSQQASTHDIPLSPSIPLKKRKSDLSAKFISSTWAAPIALLLLLIVTAAVRLPNVTLGLPYEYGWDEPEIMLPAIRLIREGIYIPYKFDYGPLNGYTHAGWAVLTFVRGIGKGQFPDGIWGIQSDLTTGWYWTVTSSYLLKYARVLSVLLAMLSVAMVYLAALHLWRRLWPAVFAGGVMALNGAFTTQTSLVSADATTIAAVSVCLWAGIHIFLHRSRWAYVTAGIAAAAATAYKYNNVFVVLLPVLAHFLAIMPSGTEKHRHTHLVRYFVWCVLCGILFMLPVFLQPTRFLHDVATVLGYYAEPKDSTLLTSIAGYIKRGMALLDMGRITAPGKGIQSVSELRFNMRWAGLGILPVVVAGIIAAAIWNRRLLLLLAPIVALNFINVGGDTGFFYPRYLLLSLPFLAMFGGFAVYTAERYLPARRLAPALLAAACILLLMPSFLSLVKRGREAASRVDPRSQMSAFMDANLPSGTRILVLEESRYSVSRPESKKYKVAKANVMQIQQYPELLASSDYLLAPRSVYFHGASTANTTLADTINAWLARLTPAKKYGSEPIALDGPDVGPAVQLVKLPQGAPATTATLPRSTIEGMAFIGSNFGGTVLGNGDLGIRASATVTARVELPADTKNITVRAQGTAPYTQEKPAELDIQVTPLPADPAAQPATRTLTLNRSQGGLNDYSAPMPLKAGQYQVTIKPRDQDNLLTRLRSVDFK